jgi:integrase
VSTLADTYLHQLFLDGTGRSHLEACRRTLGELEATTQDCPVAAISREDAHQHINTLRRTLRVNTVRTRAKIMSGFFNWLRDERSLVEANVFKGLRIRGEVDEPRRSWTPEEVRHVWARMASTPIALDLLRLLNMTGMRCNEAAQLRCSDIEDIQACGESRWVIRIRESKTQAGVRAVPVHWDLAIHIEAMMRTIQDANAFLLDCGGGYRGCEAYIGSKIRLAMRADGLSYRGLVLHGLRNTFATLLEQAGISEGVSADIMGHKRNTITYGLYSGGTSTGQRFEAIDRLRFATDWTG